MVADDVEKYMIEQPEPELQDLNEKAQTNSLRPQLTLAGRSFTTKQIFFKRAVNIGVCICNFILNMMCYEIIYLKIFGDIHQIVYMFKKKKSAWKRIIRKFVYYSIY